MVDPQILTGALKLAAGDGLTTGLVDVSDHVTAFIISQELDEIQIPATLATPRGSRPGSLKNTIQIDYFPTVASVTSVWTIFRAAIKSTTTQRGFVSFQGQITDDAISATNPLYGGTFVVVGNKIGGNAYDVMTASQTFPLKGDLTEATS